MSNFEKKLEEATEEELRFWVNECDFRVVPLASDELTRRDLQKLQKAIKANTKQMANFADATNKFNTETSRQTKKLISLTKLIAFLTIVMIGGLVFQIYLAKIQVSPILSEQQRNERRAYEFCAGYPEGDWPSATGGQVSCTEVLKILEGKFE